MVMYLTCNGVILFCAFAQIVELTQQLQEPREKFEIVNEWKFLDFEYPSYVQRQMAIAKSEFIAENNLPLGIDVHGDRLFVTTPRWKDGVPASFSYLPYPARERSPALRPYPNWAAHGNPYAPDCSKLMSVYRSFVDSDCNRLWLIDAGIVNATVQLNPVCPPKIRAYDLSTDELLLNHELPTTAVRQDSLHSNLVVDVRDNRCQEAHIYVTDVWRYGIYVYSVAKGRGWRVTNYQFAPHPQAADFNLYGLNFQWLDGVFGLSLSLELGGATDRVLYFHPMASYKEFMVSTALLQDENIWTGDYALQQQVARYFVAIGDRGVRGQSSTAGVARNGVQFFTQVHRDNIACWDTSKPYVRANLLQVLSDPTTDKNITYEPLIQFPNDLKLDSAPRQSVWVMSNRLPIYLYGRLDYTDLNFRILRADVEDLIEGTVCHPKRNGYDESDAYLSLQLREGQCY